jgi:hypothetical protein
MSNYSRKCRDCGRWINLREMPHGKWVAFEGDQSHKCDKPPASKATPSAKPKGSHPKHQTEPFEPLYPKVLESRTPGPRPSRPQPTPLQPSSNLPNRQSPAPPVHPTPAPRPEPPPCPSPVLRPEPTPRPMTGARTYEDSRAK